MHKRDIFSLITNPIRNLILKRLASSQKAAYSDLLDTVQNHLHPLTSSGNFNYHLNFLINNSLIVKDGLVYRLTDKGKEVTRFVETIDHQWVTIEKFVRGEHMSVFNLAEQFEEETGIQMDKEIINFKGSNMIMDTMKIIGILPDIEENELFSDYEELDVEQFGMKKLTFDQESGTPKTVVVLKHPDIDYYLSPKYFAIIQEYSEKIFGMLKVYAKLEQPSPFLAKAENRKNKCYFVIAPSYADKDNKKMVKKE